MPDAGDLLAVARSLVAAPGPSDAALRRAVSTGYYALFHAVLREAAARFADEGSAAHALIYRAFEHGQMRAVCEAVDRDALADRWARALGRRSVSRDARDFAGAFVVAQERRMAADYDPRASFYPSDVRNGLDEVGRALDAFARVAPGERADLLALLMVRARG